MRTRKGRVVYDRKKNVFRYSDLFRICRSFGAASVIFRIRQENWSRVVDSLKKIPGELVGGVYDFVAGIRTRRVGPLILAEDFEITESIRAADIVLLYKVPEEEE